MPVPTSLPTSIIDGNTGHDTHHDIVHSLINQWTVMPIQTRTGSYVLALADGGETVVVDSAVAATVMVPPSLSVPFPLGTVVSVVRYGVGPVGVAAGVGVVLRSPASLDARTQFSALTLVKYGPDEWIVSGDLA